MTPAKIGILVSMLVFGLVVWRATSPREPHAPVASLGDADAAMEVCRYAVKEGLGNPPGLVWAESGGLTDQADGIWNVRVIYRATGISPRISFCKLRPMGDGSWQSFDF